MQQGNGIAEIRTGLLYNTKCAIVSPCHLFQKELLMKTDQIFSINSSLNLGGEHFLFVLNSFIINCNCNSYRVNKPGQPVCKRTIGTDYPLWTE